MARALTETATAWAGRGESTELSQTRADGLGEAGEEQGKGGHDDPETFG